MVLTHASVAPQILFLTPSARAQFSSGRIFSHVTSDAETIYQLSTSGLGLISSPLRIIGAQTLQAEGWHRCMRDVLRNLSGVTGGLGLIFWPLRIIGASQVTI